MVGFHDDWCKVRKQQGNRLLHCILSKWKYDDQSIQDRNVSCTYYPESCQDENWFKREFGSQFKEKFGINKTLSYAFLDSWSQTRPNDEDPTQQEHWKEETTKHWEYSDKDETFTFMTIDDVLDENAACKKENKKLHAIINEAISNLTQQGGQLFGTYFDMI